VSKFSYVELVGPGEINKGVGLSTAKNIKVIDLPLERKISLISDVVCFFKLIFIFRSARRDIAITLFPKAGLLGQITLALASRKSRRIHVFTGQVWANYTGFRRFFFKVTDSLVARLASECLVDSKSQLEYLQSELFCSPRNVQVIHNGSIKGVDLQRFRYSPFARNDIRAKIGIPHGSKVLIFVGRISRDKGVDLLVEIFDDLSSAHPDLWLLLVGAIEDWSDVGELRCGCNDRVVWVDHCGNVAEYLCAGDIFCIPSKREGFGLSVIEASSVELPVVGSDIVGLQDSISDGRTGFLIDPWDKREWVNTLFFLLNDETERKRLGVEGRRFVRKNFNVVEVVNWWVELLR
jgi:glycosyltransferase involved in cell wall biosynthesis